MQVISSLVSLQAEELNDVDMRAVLQEITHRVRSMALVHEKLYQSADLARIEFDKYAQSLLNYLWHAHGRASSDVRLSLDLEPVSLSVNEAVPCGLILNELVCNILKHAFDGREDGKMAVSLQNGLKEGQVRLCVRDNGAGFPVGFDWRQARTLGLRLVRMLAGQLRAEVEFSSKSGTEFIMIFERPKI
jgi:two-component sensor histidine kinase